jgi:putative addiction module killer protein
MKKYNIKTYKKFDLWIKKLDDKTQDIIFDRIFRLSCGNIGDYKNIGDGIFELRIFFGAGYRIYFALLDDIVVILINGGNKDSQKKDIKKAKEYWQEIKKDTRS